MQHEIFNFNETQNQIILSGILGEGNIRRNGGNRYYRETHSKKEKDYCKYKCDCLQPYISKSGFHVTDKRDGQFGFQTRNSPTLIYYKNLTKLEVIEKLNHYGLLLYILDDGWFSYDHHVLSLGTLTEKEQFAVRDKYNKEFNIKSHIIGINRKDLSFAGCQKEMIPYFIKLIPNHLDVFRKKVTPIINQQHKFKV